MEIKHIHPVHEREQERRQKILEIKKDCSKQLPVHRGAAVKRTGEFV